MCKWEDKSSVILYELQPDLSPAQCIPLSVDLRSCERVVPERIQPEVSSNLTDDFSCESGSGAFGADHRWSKPPVSALDTCLLPHLPFQTLSLFVTWIFNKCHE